MRVASVAKVTIRDLKERKPVSTGNAVRRNGIADDQAVRCHEGQSLHHGLCNQHAVERVFVERGEILDHQRMGAVDTHVSVAIVEQAPAKRMRVDLKIVSSKPVLNDDFPKICGAEVEQVLGCRKQRARLLRPALRIARRPKQHLGIEQQPHGCSPNIARMTS